MAALAGALAAAAEAGRYAGGGMRTMGRRAGRSDLSRQTQAAARESRRRANLAFQILRGLEPPVEPRPTRRPALYIAVGILAGTTGAVVVEALRRAVANGAGRSWADQVRGLASRRAPGEPATQPGVPEDAADDRARR